ncbi:MAG: hypothetical protein GY842_01715 [bacterium]|nr:hypothetical protein [bacterium]
MTRTPTTEPPRASAKSPPPSDGESGEARTAAAVPVGNEPSGRRPAHDRRPGTGLTLLAVACATLAGWWWLQQRALGSAGHALAAQAAALARMETDAEIIAQLRSAPRTAAERRRPNAELLAQIDRALAGAGVPKKLWQDSIPQAPQQLANSPYTRHTTQLYFEDITLRQATALVCRLLGEDPSLSLSSVHVSAGRGSRKNAGGAPTWRIDLAVSYLTYAPAEGVTGSPAEHRN